MVDDYYDILGLLDEKQLSAKRLKQINGYLKEDNRNLIEANIKLMDKYKDAVADVKELLGDDEERKEKIKDKYENKGLQTEL